MVHVNYVVFIRHLNGLFGKSGKIEIHFIDNIILVDFIVVSRVGFY